MDCLFCKIIAGEIPSTKVYEDDKVYAFNDIAPLAPTHILVIPKTHLSSFDEIDETHADLLGYMSVVISKLAKENKLAKGYRVVTNIGDEGCQSVHHLHFHLLGGKQLDGKLG